ncbi:tetratricopeptide repeat-containing sensor histidine kinase [Jiulongibacter sediminis]|uniref:tetratricopeptide repeat-containing sensor histidine kinase n=1 Tax=Jiulongibacter sediminis TaxID=1605367 RepID=UPI00103ED276|nr:histidine kinase dimerization/phosphoacceptor domain -containing protein [Jiulongibacter sediminis]
MKRTLTIACLLALKSIFAFAQEKKGTLYDLPENQNIHELPLDTFLVKVSDAINEMKGKTDSMIREDLGTLLNKVQKGADPLTLAKTYQEFANWHFLSVYSENNDSIYHYDELALQYLKQTDEKELMAKAYKTVGFDLSLMQRFSDAEEAYFEGLSIAEEFGFEKLKFSIYASLSNLYSSTKDFESALKYGEMVVDQYSKDQNTHPLIRALISLNDLHVKMGEPEKALTLISRALELVKELPERYQNSEKYNVLAWRGKTLRALKRYDEALADFQFSWNGMKEIYGEERVDGWKGDIGSIYFLKKEYAKAIPFLKGYVEHLKGKKVYNAEELKNHYHWLAESYLKTNQPVLAYQYLSEGNEIALNALDQEVQALKNELRVKYETEQKDKTIASQSDQIAQQKRIQLLGFLIGVLLLILATVLYLAFSKNRKKNRQLEELNADLETSNAQLDKRNKENELLLKEIHHRVKNNLEIVSSLLELQSSHIDDPSVQEAVSSSKSRVYSMGIIHQKLYQRDQLTSVEMRDYLINLSENISNSFSPDGKIKIECNMPELVLDVDTAMSVGLIANEVLTNAFKYAFKGKSDGKIEINMKPEGPDKGNIELQIKDNGVGRDKDKPSKGTGFGTMLMELLTKQLGGTLTYNVDNGTMVSLIFSSKRDF